MKRILILKFYIKKAAQLNKTVAGNTQFPCQGVVYGGLLYCFSGNSTSERSESRTAHTSKRQPVKKILKVVNNRGSLKASWQDGFINLSL
jgi:hypothetical protein